jgi:hypothetical protein
VKSLAFWGETPLIANLGYLGDASIRTVNRCAQHALVGVTDPEQLAADRASGSSLCVRKASSCADCDQKINAALAAEFGLMHAALDYEQTLHRSTAAPHNACPGNSTLLPAACGEPARLDPFRFKPMNGCAPIGFQCKPAAAKTNPWQHLFAGLPPGCGESCTSHRAPACGAVVEFFGWPKGSWQLGPGLRRRKLACLLPG